MEFKLISPLNESGFAKIEFNFAELKTELSNSLEKYKNLVYTDEQIKEAKADRANLNKFKEALDTKRKEIKKMCLAPYEEFESKVKELLALVDEPILTIDTQVKAFEDKKAQAKREEIQTIYKNTIGGLCELVPLDKIFNQKWLNVTYSLKQIEKDINSIIDKVLTETKTITDLKLGQNEIFVLKKYYENLSLSEALAEKLKLEQLKSNLTTIETKTETIKEDVKPVLNDNADTYKVVFEVEATKEQLQIIKRFLIENDIKYGSVK